VIGIRCIFTEIPTHRLETLPREEALGLKPGTVETRIGVRRIARKAPHQDTSDLCVAAADRLFASGAVAPSQIDCLIVVTQNPDGAGLPHTSAIVHGKLGLPEDCAAFDIGLGCSGYVYALSIAKGFMEANGLKCGLLFTADPYSKVIDDNDRRTALLFGDAAAVTLLTDNPAWSIGRFTLKTCGLDRDAIRVRSEIDGKFFMDGKQVLAFSNTKVPDSIREAVRLNGLSMEDIDRFVLHQGSRAVIDGISEALGADDRIAFHAGDYGNTVSSSIPIVLARDLLETDRRVVISGFGVGLSWASTLLTRSP
jgi:3-oxoacyl-[acyl-carrier-protein] synthase-3